MGAAVNPPKGIQRGFESPKRHEQNYPGTQAKGDELQSMKEARKMTVKLNLADSQKHNKKL
jgi:hypothetical protein